MLRSDDAALERYQRCSSMPCQRYKQILKSPFPISKNKQLSDQPSISAANAGIAPNSTVAVIKPTTPNFLILLRMALSMS
ncbi:hypothetical protein CBM2634_U300004 [Cupriavidus taiwanensis]|uniref:Uncharacterized protein n=1 Tax=Cupriavidus taiwanensis TaxID=164546 RepID=A0A375JCD7_9BURK|nr:hypothetical protein CBM2634_U300004 [Cupriavidus taiwanensis]